MSKPRGSVEPDSAGQGSHQARQQRKFDTYLMMERKVEGISSVLIL